MDFSVLNLKAPLLRAAEEAGYTQPSPIQQKAIPPVLAGHDLLGCAQTGTGKTAAFAMPMLQLLAARRPNHRKVRALVLTPTRELALQIDQSFAAYGKYLTLSHAVVFGGVGQAPQVAALQKGVDILVACPGRLNDLIGQGHVDLSAVEIFVLDEADRMLDMGFVHDVKKVIRHLPQQRQNLMFSATMPKEIEELAGSILHAPVTVKVDPVSSTVDRIDQSVYKVAKTDKARLLVHLLRSTKAKNALVFSRTKHGADKIARVLNKEGIPAAAIHGNKSQTARVTALDGFKAGRVQVLVATDIAARGIDISELSHVFNYDLPEVPETYVHRIGRTARAGQSGTAISFCSPEEEEYLQGIEKLNRKKIPVVQEHPCKIGAAQTQALQSAPAEKKPAKPAAQQGQKRAPKAKTSAPDPRPQNEGRKEEPAVEENQKQGTGLSASAKRRRRRRRAATRPEGQNNAAPAQEQEPRSGRERQAPRDNNNQRAATQAQNGRQEAAPAKERQNSRGAAQTKAAPAKAAPAKAAPQQRQPRPKRPAAPSQPAARQAQSDDPGLLLISRKPPKQKFSNFEEYIQSHGGVTAPIEGEEKE